MENYGWEFCSRPKKGKIMLLNIILGIIAAVLAGFVIYMVVAIVSMYMFFKNEDVQELMRTME